MPNLAGIDLRGDGGYIVAPPSIHTSGNRYLWLDLATPREVDHPDDHHQGQDDQDNAHEQIRHAWTLPARALAVLPEWIQDEPRSPVPAGPPSDPRFNSGDGTAYGLAALEGALTSLRSAPIGRRNHTLNRVAFCMAQLVAGGELLESAACSSLLGVSLAIGLDEPESRQTIDSAFAAGTRQPRCAPHRLAGRGG